MPSARAIRSSFLRYLPALLLLPLAGFLWFTSAPAAATAIPLPNPAVDQQNAGDEMQVAVIAGGCFWGIQAVFQHTKGVQQALSGYSGGTKTLPRYEEVVTGRTGHAESVQIKFNPREISYGQILKIFFSVAHDPTQLNRQGPDVGTHYRSAIFYANDEQKRIAEAYIAQLGTAGAFRAPIVTEVTPLAMFYPAESYHQDYAINHPTQPYIVIHDLPKVENLKRLFPDFYRAAPVTVAAAGQ
ncbi:MAG: peptide-methionine (S)-S-oxide reductase MsrA [Xanthobacteraceae bacterium]